MAARSSTQKIENATNKASCATLVQAYVHMYYDVLLLKCYIIFSIGPLPHSVHMKDEIQRGIA